MDVTKDRATEVPINPAKLQNCFVIVSQTQGALFATCGQRFIKSPSSN